MNEKNLQQTSAYGAPSSSNSQEPGSFHDFQRNPMQMQMDVQ